MSTADREVARQHVVKHFPNALVINELRGDIADITILVEHRDEEEISHLKDYITINYKTGEVV